MSVYDTFMKPLEKRGIQKAREKLIQHASGNVLEIGSGTGVNLKYYNCDKLDSLILTDKNISKHLLKKDIKCQTVEELDVTALPYDDKTFDTVVHTLVFCSVKDHKKGILEISRVLKDDGKVIFIEHVLPHNYLKPVFKTVNPIWRLFSGGCQLTKNHLDLIKPYFDIILSNEFMNTVFVSGIAKKKIQSE